MRSEFTITIATDDEPMHITFEAERLLVLDHGAHTKLGPIAPADQTICLVRPTRSVLAIVQQPLPDAAD